MKVNPEYFDCQRARKDVLRRLLALGVASETRLRILNYVSLFLGGIDPRPELGSESIAPFSRHPPSMVTGSVF